MNGLNAIVIDGKVYEAFPTTRSISCGKCDLRYVCDEHSYDPCNDMSKLFDTYIDDAYWHFRFNQELTDKLNEK